MERVRVNKGNSGDGRRWVAVMAAISGGAGKFRVPAAWLAATLVFSTLLVVTWNHPSVDVSAPAIVFSAMLGWLLGAEVPFRKAGAATPDRTSAAQLSPTRWTDFPESPGRQVLLKSALENLANVEALGRSPLTRLPALSSSHNSGVDLRDMLVAVVTELTASRAPRDREAGQLLFDYYVKRVGSHEVVMERLCLSRPTFYRRLQRGFERLAERLDGVNEFAARSEEAIA